MKKQKKLGIIGGVGPLATMFIGEKIVRMTDADRDQDHVNMIISNNTNIPDRTAFILGKSVDDPVPVIVSDAKMLQEAGAEVLILPCNTAHTYYDKIQEKIELPLINMIYETVVYAKENGANKVGILATTGTITTGIYQSVCKELEMTPVVPNKDIQELVMSLIYDDVKAGKPADREKWNKVEIAMQKLGCDTIILGCTELSIVKEELKLVDCIDSLLVLAKKAIEKCGYQIKLEK